MQKLAIFLRTEINSRRKFCRNLKSRSSGICHRPRLLAVLAFEVLETKPSVESEAAKPSQIALETVSTIDILAAVVFVLHKKVMELS